MHRTLVIVATALLVFACDGNTVKSPTSQTKQCLFDTECMSSQRCLREKDNLMGVCVDKVAAQPGDGTSTTGAMPTDALDGSAPAPLAPPIQPQPGDISL